MSVYLDNASTTELSASVKRIMVECLTNNEMFGNYSSNTHDLGFKTKKLLDKARQDIANKLNALDREIIFTSGATESNNLAIKGVAYQYRNKGKHIITSKVEHKAVLDVCEYLKKDGFEITYLSPNSKGEISYQQVKNAIKQDTILVSLMAVNNELGTKNNLLEIGKITKEKKIIFHVDGAQGFGKIDIDINKMNIDLLSVSGHKIYGPKGIGFLYVRSKRPRIKLQKQIHGGSQEFSLRAGTLANHQILGLAEAVNFIYENKQEKTNKIKQLRDIFLSKIKTLNNVQINTDINNSYYGILNITFNNIKAETLIAMLKNVAISMGSACNSHSIEPSHVLSAIGLTPKQADSTIRVSFGLMNNLEEVERVAIDIVEKVSLLRKILPFREY